MPCLVHYLVRVRRRGFLSVYYVHVCTVCGAEGKAAQKPSAKQPPAEPKKVDTVKSPGGPTKPGTPDASEKPERFFIAKASPIGPSKQAIQLVRLDETMEVEGHPKFEGSEERGLTVIIGDKRYAAKPLTLALGGRFQEALKVWRLKTKEGARLLVRTMDMPDVPEVIGARAEDVALFSTGLLSQGAAAIFKFDW